MNDVEQQWPDEPPQQWPEDVADWPQTASTVQGGVVSPQVRCDNAVSELVTAVEKLLEDVDLQAPEGFLQECLNSGRLVNVHELIRCAEALARVKGGDA